MSPRSDPTRISVVIPTYNRPRATDVAVGRVRAQALPPDWSVEIVVVDDGSSEPPLLNNVRLVRHDRNRGAAAARNTGIANAAGAYIAFLDSDDVWLPGKLAAQISAMDANGWAASCTSYVLAKQGQREIVSPRYPTMALGLDELVWGCFVSPGSTLICRREVFDEVGVFDTTLPRLEDWDWLLRYVARYPLGFLAEPLARIEPSSGGRATQVAPALDILEARYRDKLTGRHRRQFAAALEFERAASHYRSGDRMSAFLSALNSLRHAPLHHGALAATLHNRFGAG
jgi:glycosyltransferase involved in cell wall biosynthesis